MQCYLPNFKYLSQAVLKKIFQLFSMYICGSNAERNGAGPFRILVQLDK